MINLRGFSHFNKQNVALTLDATKVGSLPERTLEPFSASAKSPQGKHGGIRKHLKHLKWMRKLVHGTTFLTALDILVSFKH